MVSAIVIVNIKVTEKDHVSALLPNLMPKKYKLILRNKCASSDSSYNQFFILNKQLNKSMTQYSN